MVYCHSCGQQNPDGSNYCNKCAAFMASDRKFEDEVKRFADDMSKFGKEVGEKASEIGKRVAKDAKAFAEEVAKKVAPKPLDCPQCGEKIFETDVFCWKCGDKRV